MVKSDKMKKGKRKSNKEAADSDRKRRRHGGPHLPSSFRKELGLLNPNPNSESDTEGEAEGDLYEYEEAVPQEESGRNRRFDDVENYEYDLPEDFKDEEVPSDEEEEEEGEGEIVSDESDGEGEERGEKHLRMLQEITGMPKEAFGGGKKKEGGLSDEEENGGDRKITVHDLVANLSGKPGHTKLRQRIREQDKRSMLVDVPLPSAERKKVERKVVHKNVVKEITKWEPLIKRNREAPTLYFEQDVQLGYSTVGAIASEFVPRTDFERKMAELVRDPHLAGAHKEDGARLLELNKVSVDDVKERQNRLAKMRSLLFRHEVKAKRIKKIKSKTYHKILKKEKQRKTASAELEMDPEAARESARIQEFKRAEERMTLKHKNSSKWAKRILKRGLNVQDEGTRAAIVEQLHQHQLLKRKMDSMREDTDSSDESSSDESEEGDHLDEKDRAFALLNRAKESTSKVVGGDELDDLPKSGIFTLPFMERGLKKRKEEAYEEARLALQEYDESLRQLQDENEGSGTSPGSAKLPGRRIFGPVKNTAHDSNKRRPSSHDVRRNSDSEDDDDHDGDDVNVDYHDNDQINPEQVDGNKEGIQLGTALIDDETVMSHNALYKSLDDIVKNPGPKSTCEVAIFAGNSWKKVTSDKRDKSSEVRSVTVKDPLKSHQAPKEMDADDDVADDDVADDDVADDDVADDDEEEMVDGFLPGSADPTPEYELPSQSDLINRAFAGDDVAADFARDKLETLNEENPEPEKPALVPGWGQWTSIQKKKGLPHWMVKEHESEKRKREQALNRRKDAKLKHVIISENIDKKAQKLMVKNLPYPYTSKELYERSTRMPIGPDFNPAISVPALIRPSVVKKPGVVIKPIQYEEVDPHEKPDEPKRIIQKMKPNSNSKAKKGKPAHGKQSKKASANNRS